MSCRIDWSRYLEMLELFELAKKDRRRIISHGEYTGQERLSMITKEIIRQLQEVAPWIVLDHPDRAIIVDCPSPALVFRSGPSAVAWDADGRVWNQLIDDGWLLLYDPYFDEGGCSELPAEDLELYLGLLFTGLTAEIKPLAEGARR